MYRIACYSNSRNILCAVAYKLVYREIVSDTGTRLTSILIKHQLHIHTAKP